MTPNIGTFTFKQLDEKPARNYKGWYQDLGMVAKHFTVSSLEYPQIRRQYTICQTMEMENLRAFRKLADDILHAQPGEKVTIDESFFSSEDTGNISLTLKNYDRPHGVAT